MKFSFNSILNKTLLVGASAAALVSCSDPDYPAPTPTTSAPLGQARILVVNAAPGTTGTSVNLDNATLSSALPYLGTTASYTATQGGGQRLFVINDPANIPAAPTGGTPVTAPRTLVSRTSYLGGTNYTVFITDQPTRAYVAPVTATSDQGGIRTLVVTDDLTPPAAGKAKVRFFNLSPSQTTAVGLYNVTAASFLFTTRGYRAITSGTTSLAAFTEVNAGTYTLDVRTAATAVPSIAPQQFTFADGKIYTLYTRGVSGTGSTTPLGISVVTHN